MESSADGGFIALLALLGLMVGSFCNVCVHRIPRGQSIVWPGSHCPHCQHAIAWYDNLPVLSWLWLGGRCRHCRQPIAVRYPLLELLVAISWAWLAWAIGPSDVLIEALVLMTWLWVLTLIDLETMLLPDVLTFSGIALGLAFSAWFDRLPDALIGAAAGYGFFWLVARAYALYSGREGMGAGDFKLLAMLGAFMGWQALPFIVFLASTTGVLFGGAWLWYTRKHTRAEIPFGPFLSLAGALWYLWGSEWLQHWPGGAL